MSLPQLRHQIDQLDQQIITLLAERMQLVQKVGQHKAAHEIPSLSPERWQHVLQTRQTWAQELGLEPELVLELWNCIHQHALKLEDSFKKERR